MSSIAADVETFLRLVGPQGCVLTGTRRLRLADVRAINSGFREPELLDHDVRGRLFKLRSEEQAWRVQFVRLLAEAAGLVRTSGGRLIATARGERFARARSGETDHELFRAWWWKGEWSLLGAGWTGWIDLSLELDRSATARELLSVGAGDHDLGELGRRLRDRFAPATFVQVLRGLLEPDVWGIAAWNLCLRPLAAFGGVTEIREVETWNDVSFDRLVGVHFGHGARDLFADALAHETERPARRPSVRTHGAAAGASTRNRAARSATARRRS